MFFPVYCLRNNPTPVWHLLHRVMANIMQEKYEQ